MGMRYNPEKHGYTGKMFERDFIGGVRKDDAYYDALADWAHTEAIQKMHGKSESVEKPNISAENEKDTYINFYHALDIAKRFQADDPLNPQKELARDLRLEVADILGLADEADLERIRFYSGTDTPLDWYHGTDCFMEYINKNGETHLFRFDLTENPQKTEEVFNRKGAMIVSGLPDPQEESGAYLEKIHTIAEQVAHQFRAEESEHTA